MAAKNDELIVLLQNSWELIEYAKKQQWRVTYYAFLFFAAIIAFITKIKDDNYADLVTPLFLFAWFIWFFAHKTIFHSHDSICKARKRIKYWAKKVSDEFWEAWKSPSGFDVSTYDDPNNARWYPVFLSILNFAGALFVTFVANI